MKSLSPALEQHRNMLRDGEPWIWLFEVEIPSSPKTRLRLARYTDPVSFGVDSTGAAIVYSPFGIAIGERRETVDGDIPTLAVEVANPSREIGLAIDQYDGLVGAPVVIRIVHASDLANFQSQIEERAEVRRARVTGDRCTFVLAAYALYRRPFPAWRYLAFNCRWQFGGPECGYAIPASPGGTVGTGFATCGRTFTACDERGDDEVARSLTRQHPKRFGGFPGMRRQAGGI